MRTITFTITDHDYALIDTQRRKHHHATMASYVRWQLLSAVPEADALPMPVITTNLKGE